MCQCTELSTPSPDRHSLTAWRYRTIADGVFLSQVGECRSLIFGVSLSDYDFARGEGGNHGGPPTIVEKCVAALEERGEVHALLRECPLTSI